MKDFSTAEGIRWFLIGILFHTLGMNYDFVQTIDDGLEVKGLRCPPLKEKGGNPEWEAMMPVDRKQALIRIALKNSNDFLGARITWEQEGDKDIFRYNLKK